MKLIVLKQDNLAAVTAQLNATGTDQAATAERWKQLNPHIADFTRLEPGAVLFVPDAPAPTTTQQPDGTTAPAAQDGTDATRTADADAFADLTSDIAQGLKLGAARVQAGFDQLAADRKDVAAALKTDAVQRLMAGDATLKAQVDAANTQFAQDAKAAKETPAQLDELQQGAAAELAALAKLLGP